MRNEADFFFAVCVHILRVSVKKSGKDCYYESISRGMTNESLVISIESGRARRTDTLQHTEVKRMNRAHSHHVGKKNRCAKKSGVRRPRKWTLMLDARCLETRTVVEPSPASRAGRSWLSSEFRDTTARYVTLSHCTRAMGPQLTAEEKAIISEFHDRGKVAP